MKLEKIHISDKFSKLPAGDYAVGLIAKMNDDDFKIVKFKGDFVWQSHPETDEIFIIVDGTLVMNFRDRITSNRWRRPKRPGGTCSTDLLS